MLIYFDSRNKIREIIDPEWFTQHGEKIPWIVVGTAAKCSLLCCFDIFQINQPKELFEFITAEELSKESLKITSQVRTFWTVFLRVLTFFSFRFKLPPCSKSSSNIYLLICLHFPTLIIKAVNAVFFHSQSTSVLHQSFLKSFEILFKINAEIARSIACDKISVGQMLCFESKVKSKEEGSIIKLIIGKQKSVKQMLNLPKWNESSEKVFIAFVNSSVIWKFLAKDRLNDKKSKNKFSPFVKSEKWWKFHVFTILLRKIIWIKWNQASWRNLNIFRRHLMRFNRKNFG